ncbi:MAG: ArnT family glycosyltransferase [Bacteroidales bacterium]
MKNTVLPSVILAALLSIYLLISSNIGGVSVYILDESKNASCAREMMERKDLIVPTFNYELRTDKPVLHYYFMMAGYQLFGVNAFGARFFSVIFGCLTLVITFLFAKKYYGIWTGIWAVLTLTSSLHYVLQFQLAVPDPYLIFFINASLMCFFVYWTDKRPVWIYLCYAAMALGTLTKGPVAAILPGLVFFVFLLVSRALTLKNIFSLRPFSGIVLYMIIALPWYILVHLKTNGEWTEGFFLRHNLERFTSTMEGHGGSFYYPLIYFFIGLLPFVILSIQSLWTTLKDKTTEAGRFLFIVIGVVLVFFAFSKTQLPNYIVPLYPAFAIIISAYLDKIFRGIHTPGGWKVSLWLYGVLMILLPVGIWYGLSIEPELSHISHLWIFFLLWPAGALTGLFWVYKNHFRKAALTLSVSSILTMAMFFYVVFPMINNQNPIQVFEEYINKEAEYVWFNRMNPAFVFWLKREIPRVTTLKEIELFLNQNPRGYIISSLSDFERNEELMNEAGLEILVKQKDLFENPTTIIMHRPRQ